MPVLRSQQGTTVPLASRTLIGRSVSCLVRIDRPAVSGEHALLQWDGAQWILRDLGSRNGTFRNGAKLDAGETVAVHAGDGLAFGDAEQGWSLEGDGPPDPVAVELASRRIARASGGMLALPSEKQPAAVAYETPGEGWIIEVDGEPRAASEQEVVQIDGASWVVMFPVASELTPLLDDQRTIESVRFRFEVSSDEEYVRFGFAHRGSIEYVGAREHNYVLLTLARIRADERDRSVGERGWVDRDQLLSMLRMERTALNVAIHRARLELRAAGVVDAARVVEVRRNARRFGSDDFEIVTL